MPALGVIIALAGTASSVLAHGFHGDHAKALAYAGPLTYLWYGAVHMVTGYDHLLFLFGVMFLLTSTGDIVRFVSAFTLGHSITLIAATLFGAKADAYLVDAVIALSVIYKGFDNFDGFRRWIGIDAPHLIGVVFGFGLLHGFGLATRIQSHGLPRDGLVARLLAFNIGVELGQVAALAVMIGLLAWLRRTKAFAPFSVVANAFLIVAGGLLFLNQLHGYQHNAYPDEFGFSSSSHILDHYKSDIPSNDTGSKVLDMAPEPAPPKERIPPR
jgi:hypothetical protein